MNIKTLSLIAVVTAAVSAPAFAQEADTTAAQKPAHALRHYRNAYNQAPGYVAPRASTYGVADPENHIDRSRPGGVDPDFNPAGN